MPVSFEMNRQKTILENLATAVIDLWFDRRNTRILLFRNLERSIIHIWPTNKSDNGKTGRIKMQMSRNQRLIWIPTVRREKCGTWNFYACYFHKHAPDLQFRLSNRDSCFSFRGQSSNRWPFDAMHATDKFLANISLFAALRCRQSFFVHVLAVHKILCAVTWTAATSVYRQ